MSKGRILIIEDNVDNLELVRFLLERAGYQVLTASNGMEGLAVAQTASPDLVLLDLGLPDINGWELAGRLKDDPFTRHIPLVALTAHTLPGDRKRALESGCDGYITKPLNIATLGDDIARYLKPEG